MKTTRVWLMFLCTLRVGASEVFPVLRNDTVWRDTAGEEIRAQGGSILREGDTYYWYGFDGEMPAKDRRRLYKGVRCYRSKNLVNWSFVGVSFDETAKNPNRLDVVRSAKDGRCYMFCKHMDLARGVGVAVADGPEERFVWKGFLALPDSVGGGDQSVFVDDDGRAYLVYTPWREDPVSKKMERNRHLTIAALSEDFGRIERVVVTLQDTRVEAPAIFKRDGLYYWMNSGIAWWFSSPTSWMSAERLEGPWTPLRTLAGDPESPQAERATLDSYDSQHDFVLPVRGAKGTMYIYCGDRYSNYTTWGVGRSVWLPLEFRGDVPVLNWHRSWQIDVTRGVWHPLKDDSQSR